MRFETIALAALLPFLMAQEAGSEVVIESMAPFKQNLLQQRVCLDGEVIVDGAPVDSGPIPVPPNALRDGTVMRISALYDGWGKRYACADAATLLPQGTTRVTARVDKKGKVAFTVNGFGLVSYTPHLLPAPAPAQPSGGRVRASLAELERVRGRAAEALLQSRGDREQEACVEGRSRSVDMLVEVGYRLVEKLDAADFSEEERDLELRTLVVAVAKAHQLEGELDRCFGGIKRAAQAACDINPCHAWLEWRAELDGLGERPQNRPAPSCGGAD